MRQLRWREPVESYILGPVQVEEPLGTDPATIEPIQVSYDEMFAFFRAQLKGTKGRDRQIVLKTIKYLLTKETRKRDVYRLLGISEEMRRI